MTAEVTIPAQMPRRGTSGWQKFGRWLLRMLGWRLEGELPDAPRIMVILAPHTSNWDFIVGVAAILSLDMRISFLMKKEAFFWPCKNLFMGLGAIPVDRQQATDVVGQAVEWLHTHDKVWLGITPEGTRSRVQRWKTGFLRIAERADVPVLLVGMDATRKVIILDKLVRANGDHEQQAEEIRQYMNDKFIGICPQNQ
ncbi:1-acyl-sn-glycerol-3-phosphate acyltransferase [Pseudomaricurvus sp. HS19]|uniref:1-acyl-sn-glycerol-3-phosphate acyltransferase n=1 Tax=Pseudomaricurvus sp. HS19 TaxID=2692626 RepID=UPI00351A0902